MPIIQRNGPNKPEDINVFYDPKADEFVVHNQTTHALMGSFSAHTSPEYMARQIKELCQDTFNAGARAARAEIRACLGLAP